LPQAKIEAQAAAAGILCFSAGGVDLAMS